MRTSFLPAALAVAAALGFTAPATGADTFPAAVSSPDLFPVACPCGCPLTPCDCPACPAEVLVSAVADPFAPAANCPTGGCPAVSGVRVAAPVAGTSVAGSCSSGTVARVRPVRGLFSRLRGRCGCR